MKRNKNKSKIDTDKMKPKGRSKYARKGIEMHNKKTITIKATGKQIKVAKGYIE